MQIERQGRVHSLADAEELMNEIREFTGARGGCLVATVMLTERGEPMPCVVPTGVYGGDARNLDDMDRAVLVAQLWVVVQRLERDLGRGSEHGVVEFRDLVRAVRGSLLAGPSFTSIGGLAETVATSGCSECEMLSSLVSWTPATQQDQTPVADGAF